MTARKPRYLPLLQWNGEGRLAVPAALGGHLLSAILICRFAERTMSMPDTFRVQVAGRGVITLPRALRERNKIKQGDALTLIDLGGGVFVLSARRSSVDAIADRLASELRESGETLESMLGTLREVRKAADARESRRASLGKS
jgi:bifunctional DNA-binding transcriptional regulator/antitoxin component of YhaV-PrlF toxin-antitoxin module